jgi:hypothetical protein
MTELETQEPAMGAEELKSLLSRLERIDKACILDRLEALEQNWRGNESPEYDADNELLTANEGNTGEALQPAVGQDSSKSALYDKFELPESTFTLLITHRCLSIPFFTGLVACGLALTCLILVLIDELSNSTEDNKWSLPAGVTSAVRITQFLGETI